MRSVIVVSDHVISFSGIFVVSLSLDLVCGTIKDLRNSQEVTQAIRTSVMSKQYGNEDFLAKMIAQACSKLSQYYYNTRHFHDTESSRLVN